MSPYQVADQAILNSLRANIDRISERSLTRLCDAAGLEFEIEYSGPGDLWTYLLTGPGVDEYQIDFDDRNHADYRLREAIMLTLEDMICHGDVTASELMNALMFVRAA